MVAEDMVEKNVGVAKKVAFTEGERIIIGIEAVGRAVVIGVKVFCHPEAGMDNLSH
jgi:hypothetical protein